MDTHEHMIARLLGETPISAAKAARQCGITSDALVRWIRKGKLETDGTRRLLEGYPAGRSWMTTVEALARFLRGDPRWAAEEPGPTPTVPQHERDRLERAGRRLVGK